MTTGNQTINGVKTFANVDINSGTIDGTTIAFSNITGGTGKTLMYLMVH